MLDMAVQTQGSTLQGPILIAVEAPACKPIPSPSLNVMFNSGLPYSSFSLLQFFAPQP